jgi:hypothetical protein
VLAEHPGYGKEEVPGRLHGRPLVLKAAITRRCSQPAGGGGLDLPLIRKVLAEHIGAQSFDGA